MVENRRFEHTPPLFGDLFRALLGGRRRNSADRGLWRQKTSPWATVWRRLRDSAFSHLVQCRLLQTDRRTDTRRQHTALA